MTTPRTLLIAGPTASGKSALALALARRLPRVLSINADSMQVYRDLRILTARPTPDDERRMPHALFGTVDGAEAYSVARYVDDARVVLAEAQAREQTAIIVGGTGLYFKALLEGLSPVPAIDPSIRERLRRDAAEVGPARMHALLEVRDPEMAARLVPTDTQRITRALEVFESTGRSLAHWLRQPGEPVVDAASAGLFVLMPPRDDLVARCDARLDVMMASGALDEVAALRARQLPADLPVMRALGVAPLIAHLDGTLSATAAAERAKIETRQFAKRQITWLKRHMIAWQWLETKEIERNIEGIVSFIDL
jgi:tRNA dimethylallyltransferase